MPTLHKPRANGRPVPTPRPVFQHSPTSPGQREILPASQAVTVARTSVAWPGLWAVAIISTLFMMVVVSNTGDVRISFAGMSGTLPLALALLAAMGAGIVVTLILGAARLTQMRPLARKRLR
ncbi:hypothetical protein GCM10010182_04690 [Actinomadura cremea]|nr:hypothetical protein GCM10010182_04690 [Actinomadura cremea]